MKKKKNLYILIILLFPVLFPYKAFAQEIEITAFGDLYLGSRMEKSLEKKGNMFPFKGVKELLTGDIIMANLESPLTLHDIPMIEDKEWLLKASPTLAKTLKEASFNHVTLANNHILDFGMKGLSDTIKYLNEASLQYSGAGVTLREAREVKTQDFNGKKVAFLSYSNTFPKEFWANKNRGGVAPGYLKYVKNDIKKARQVADIIIVSFHWGAERMKTPKDYQVNFAKASIDAGADIIIGHHPHVLQSMERYKNGVIYYSLGNFIFGFYSKTVEGAAAKIIIDIDEKGVKTIKSAKIIPLHVDNFKVNFCPKPKRGADLKLALNEIRGRCEAETVIIDERGEILFP